MIQLDSFFLFRNPPPILSSYLTDPTRRVLWRCCGSTVVSSLVPVGLGSYTTWWTTVWDSSRRLDRAWMVFVCLVEKVVELTVALCLFGWLFGWLVICLFYFYLLVLGCVCLFLVWPCLGLAKKALILESRLVCLGFCWVQILVVECSTCLQAESLSPMKLTLQGLLLLRLHEVLEEWKPPEDAMFFNKTDKTSSHGSWFCYSSGVFDA